MLRTKNAQKKGIGGKMKKQEDQKKQVVNKDNKGVQVWQSKLRPLRKIVDVSLSVQEFKDLGIYSKTFDKCLKDLIKKAEQKVIKQDVRIPKRLQGRLNKAKAITV